MSGFKSGDRVRIVYQQGSEVKVLPTGKKGERDLFAVPLTYPYMDGLTGTVANVYNPEEIAVEVDLAALPPTVRDVHMEATVRLRRRVADLSEEARKKFTEDELNFTPHFVLLVTAKDLAPA